MLLKYKNEIDHHLELFIDQLPNLSIYDPIKYIVKLGGKRFRSSLVLLASDLYGAQPLAAINEAIAIELFHNFTLIHDDIMDDAPLRRGEKSVHNKWTSDIAILSGDLLYALVNKILAKSQSNVIHCLFHQTAIEVCEGQSLDMEFEGELDITIDQYIQMIKLKTAVLVGSSLKIGSLIGKSDQINAQLMYDFGLFLGISFQIHDDILDVYPIGETFGKQIGGDILEKKKTVLLIELFSNFSRDEKLRFVSMLDNAQINNKDKVKEAKSLYSQYNVLEKAEDLKNDYFKKSLDCIEQLTLEENKKKQLFDFAHKLMNREN